MKKVCMTLIALMLCVTTAALAPVQVMAAKSKDKLYISEVKIGMGADSQEAVSELIAEGYEILLDKNGDYSNLNYEAGTNSGMRTGPTQKVVYLGYKTTDNPKEAVTDLAVMNMNGGYSVEDYEVLLSNHLEGEIKPFVNRFIAALEEYRANYKKAENTLGHQRADYYRRMLNKLIDDDTGKPLGDLLLNKTRYEMGDKAYNTLSDKEKKNHADILTLLMQGNGRAILLLETLITKATDSAENTWLDRFMKLTTDDLMKRIKKSNPFLTTEADVIASLDKTYNDIAKRLLGKWDSFSEIIGRYDDSANEVLNAEIKVDENLSKTIKKIDSEDLSKDEAKAVTEVIEKKAECVEVSLKAEEVMIIEYLDQTDYIDGSLLEFFERDRSDFSGEGIRELYPLAASLSEGQLAGLDFLSIKDLFSMALTDEKGYSELDIKNITEASVYQDVDRAIYEPGGVALTNKALRDKQNKLDDDSDFLLSPLGFVFWGLTAISSAAAITSIALHAKYVTKLSDVMSDFNRSVKLLAQEEAYFNELMDKGIDIFAKNVEKDIATSKAMIGFEMDDIAQFTTKSSVTKWLSVGASVLTAVLAGVSIYLTVSEMLEYYQFKYTAIPRYIVDEMDIKQEVNGVETVINNQTAYYKVAQCNRKPGSSEVEKENYKVLGTANDLNGDVGKQWLALYSVKYEKGRPILAASLKVVKGSSDLPNGYETGIHRFGESAAFNLTHKYYCYNDGPDGTYVYFKNADRTVEAMTGGSETGAYGSLFSGTSMAIGAGVGLILGGGLVALIMTAINKKRKETAAA